MSGFNSRQGDPNTLCKVLLIYPWEKLISIVALLGMLKANSSLRWFEPTFYSECCMNIVRCHRPLSPRVLPMLLTINMIPHWKKSKNKAYVGWHISITPKMLYLVLDADSIHVDTCSKPKNLCRQWSTKFFVAAQKLELGAPLVLNVWTCDGDCLFNGVLWDIVLLVVLHGDSRQCAEVQH